MKRNLLKVGMFIGAPLTLATSMVCAEEPAPAPAPKAEAETESSAASTENSAVRVRGKAKRTGDLVRSYTMPDKMLWRPIFQHYQSIKLRVSGPGIEPFETEFEKGEEISFGIQDDDKSSWSDGVYSWELMARPRVSGPTEELMLDVRNEPSVTNADEVLEGSGLIPSSQSMRQSGIFTIADGKLVRQKSIRESQRDDRLRAAKEQRGLAGDVDAAEGTQLRDQVFVDDLIVQGSIGVGMDAVNGESFGFDTIRLKENNLRIRFVDTSVSASFPGNDWQITVNDSDNGGANKFSIDDIDGGKTPFTIEAGAPTNSLFVDDGGRVGIGTATPVVELHVPSGDSPTLRLEQDGTSGFTPQTWDVAGNETNFFIRDATNGSTLPFKIRPSAPTNALYIDTDGDIGLGDASPDAALDIESGDLLVTNGALTVANGTAKVENQTAGASTVLQLLSNGAPTLAMQNTSDPTNDAWNISIRNNGQLLFDQPNDAGREMTLDASGNLTTEGTVNGVSDRNAKRDIEAINEDEILAKVAELPIMEWSYKRGDPSVRHIGPMAQDFREQFELGVNDKTIALSDASGIALAAVKGLHSQMELKDKEIEDLRNRTSDLEARLLQVLKKLESE